MKSIFVFNVEDCQEINMGSLSLSLSAVLDAEASLASAGAYSQLSRSSSNRFILSLSSFSPWTENRKQCI